MADKAKPISSDDGNKFSSQTETLTLQNKVAAQQLQAKKSGKAENEITIMPQRERRLTDLEGEESSDEEEKFEKPELERQTGKALPVLETYEVPDRDTIRAYRKKIQLYDHKKQKPFSVLHSTFGRPLIGKKLAKHFDPFNESVESDFADLGPGVNSYFQFLKIYGWLFLTFGLLAAPAMAFNYLAGDSLHGSLASFSAGNLFQAKDLLDLENVSSTYDMCLDENKTCEVSRVVVYGYNIVYDIFIALLFLCVIEYSIYIFRRDQTKWVLQNPNLENFTVQVTNLPPHVKYEELKTHFTRILNEVVAKKQQEATENANGSSFFNLFVDRSSAVLETSGKLTGTSGLLTAEKSGNFRDKEKQQSQSLVEPQSIGEVYDVQIVSATREQLTLAINHAKLVKKLDHLQAKTYLAQKELAEGNISQIRYELIALEYEDAHEKLTNFWKNVPEKSFEDRSAIKAFVTFSTLFAQAEILKAYNKKIKLREAIKNLCNEPDKTLYLEDKKLKVTQAASPSVLRWENVEFNDRSKKARSCISIISVIVVLIISAIALYISGTVEDAGLFGVLDKDQKAIVNQDNLCEQFDFTGNDTDTNDLENMCINEDTEINTELTDECLEVIFCKCEFRVDHLDKGVTNKGDLCYPLFIDTVISFTFSVGNALAISLFNIVLEVLIRQSVTFEKDDDRVSEEKKLFTRLFVATYLNTALVKLVQNFDLDYLFGFTIPIIGTGSFTDFDNEWYAKVGYDFTLVALLNIITPHLFILAIYVRAQLRKRFLKPISKNDLEKLYLGRPFILAARYAQITLTIFFCMTYSAGIPLLYFVTAFAFLITFWVDKILLIKFYREPVKYSNDITIWICHILKYAIIFHLVFSILMFSSPTVFALGDSPFSFSAQDSLFEKFSNTTQVENEFFTRISAGAVLILTLLLALFVLFRILIQFETFFNLVNNLSKKAYKAVISAIKKRFSKGSEGEEELVKELEELEKLERERRETVLDKSKLVGYSSYHILANKEYAVNFKLKDGASFLGTDRDLHYSADVIPLLERGNSGVRPLRLVFERGAANLKSGRKKSEPKKKSSVPNAKFNLNLFGSKSNTKNTNLRVSNPKQEQEE